MNQLLFSCPECKFNKQVPEDKIPAGAQKVNCPKCKKSFPLDEVLKPVAAVKPEAAEEPVEKAAADSGQTASGDDKFYEMMEEGIALLEKGEAFEAMYVLEDAEKLQSTPKLLSYLAYCRAKVKDEYAESIRVCKQLLSEDPRNADLYYNLGRIYMLLKKRGPALQAFRMGIKLGPHPLLMSELKKFESRKPPVFSSLPRNHVLNVKVGKLLSKIGLR